MMGFHGGRPFKEPQKPATVEAVGRGACGKVCATHGVPNFHLFTDA